MKPPTRFAAAAASTALAAAGLFAIGVTAASPASADSYSRTNPDNSKCEAYNERVDEYFGHQPPYIAGRVKAFGFGCYSTYAWIDAPWPDTDSGCFVIKANDSIATYRYTLTNYLNTGTAKWRWCYYNSNLSLQKSSVALYYDDALGGGGGGSIP